MAKAKKSLTSDRIINQKQVKALLKELTRAKDAAVQSEKSPGFILDYFLVQIAMATGLRISEVSALTWDDIHEDFLIVKKGKGGKRREVIYGKKTHQLFEELKQHTKPHATNRIFIGERGPLTRFGVHQRWFYWKQRLGLPKSVTFHSLRHYSATFMLNNGIDLAMVRDQLGHSNISITSLYLHFTEASRERVRAIL